MDTSVLLQTSYDMVRIIEYQFDLGVDQQQAQYLHTYLELQISIHFDTDSFLNAF
jgi:hypothetical protein